MSKINSANYDSSVTWLKSKVTEVNNPSIDSERKAKLQTNIDVMQKELQLYLSSEVAKDDEHWRDIRIKKAIEMEHPLMSVEKKTEMMIEYDLIDGAILVYQRTEYCKKYPGVRDIYEQLGWVVGEGKTEPRDTSAHDVTKSVGDAKKSNGELQNEPAATDEDEYSSAADWL
ncbi:hypothetical protein HQN89_10790 [Paenibacillus frigoriresistens]|uniref:hypothetical protein n=1 Tax=Paenibacillus alginolyticus TaxID=59839 RepID=UPI001565EBF5|nr:hypothetical protein [Paenibacillus frigoriresistens]NRF91505.1 hypothetical protein [Paenibacillus frigoriresistens]